MSGALAVICSASGPGFSTPFPGGGLWYAHTTTPNAVGTLTFNADGTITFNPSASTGGSPTDLSSGAPTRWATGAMSGASVRATVNSGGALDSGTVGSWLTLSGPQVWTRQRTSPGFNISNVTFDFSLDGGASVAASLTIDFEAGVS